MTTQLRDQETLERQLEQVKAEVQARRQRAQRSHNVDPELEHKLASLRTWEHHWLIKLMRDAGIDVDQTIREFERRKAVVKKVMHDYHAQVRSSDKAIQSEQQLDLLSIMPPPLPAEPQWAPPGGPAPQLWLHRITPPAYSSEPGYEPFWCGRGSGNCRHVSCDVNLAKMCLHDQLVEGRGGIDGWKAFAKFEPISASLYFLYYSPPDFTILDIQPVVRPIGVYHVEANDLPISCEYARVQATLECGMWQWHSQGGSEVVNTGDWVRSELFNEYVDNGDEQDLFPTEPVTLHNRILAYGPEPVWIHVGASVMAEARGDISTASISFEAWPPVDPPYQWPSPHKQLGIYVPYINVYGIPATIE